MCSSCELPQMDVIKTYNRRLHTHTVFFIHSVLCLQSIPLFFSFIFYFSNRYIIDGHFYPCVGFPFFKIENPSIYKSIQLTPWIFTYNIFGTSAEISDIHQAKTPWISYFWKFQTPRISDILHIRGTGGTGSFWKYPMNWNLFYFPFSRCILHTGNSLLKTSYPVEMIW